MKQDSRVTDDHLRPNTRNNIPRYVSNARPAMDDIDPRLSSVFFEVQRGFAAARPRRGCQHEQRISILYRFAE